MTLDLIRRLVKGSPLTAVEHDGNLDVLETAIEDRALTTDLGSAAFTDSTDYAPTGSGVTNGDAHNHLGGDGGTIAFSSLGSKPTTLAGYGITDGIVSVDATAPLVSTGGTAPTLSISAATTAAAGSMSASDKNKLNGIADEATANSTDVYLLDRTNHTGTQTASTISDSTAAGRALLTAANAEAQRTSLGLGTAATTASTDYAPITHVGSGNTAHATATTTVAGFLSAADKTKLDAITVDSGTILVKQVRNDTASSIPKGTPVYITGSSGTALTIAPADASDETTSARTIGVTQTAIGSNANGYIVCVGLLDGLNTAALTEGQLVWLSEITGQFTSTQPTQPAHGVICGYCVKQGSGTSGILYIKIDNGYELDELHDVLISSASTDQALVRASDGLWKNRTIYSSTTPAALGTAAAGVGSTLARADHVHQLPTAAALGLATVATSGSASDLGTGTLPAARLPSTAVTAGSYTNASLTVDAAGRLTAASNGTAPVTSVTGAAPIVSSGGATPAISISAATTSAAGSMSSADKTKLDGVATGATANSSDATLLARANHTGTQAFSTLTAAPIEIGIACSDETTNLTTGTAKVTLRMPCAVTLTAVRLNVNTAPTGSALVVNVLQGGSTVFSTKPQIDVGAKTSVGSGTAAVISTSALTSDAEITINLDQIGSTIAGKGLKVWLIGTRA